MWAYIAVLSVIIIAIWFHFFKNFAVSAVSVKPKQPGLSEKFKELKNSLNQGGQVFGEIKSQIENIAKTAEQLATSTPATSSEPILEEGELINKLKIKLEQNKQ